MLGMLVLNRRIVSGASSIKAPAKGVVFGQSWVEWFENNGIIPYPYMKVAELAEKLQTKYAVDPYREPTSTLPAFQPTTSHPALIEKEWRNLEKLVKDIQEGGEFGFTPLPFHTQKKLKEHLARLYQSLVGS